MTWNPIGTAPYDTALLLWWTPIDDNPLAEAVVIGSVSYREQGKYWNGQLGVYENLERITHWMSLPDPPEGAKE